MSRIRKTLVVLLALTLTFLVPPSASAGETADYPEFPYAPTDYTEPYRGQFHFSSRGGWMNDINAPLYYKGEYHLFYQHNPHGLVWDEMHWGHATSKDLVHWVQKPIALEPGVHPGDLWSGAGVVDARNTSGLRTGPEDPIVVFTGKNGVRIAYSNDAGRTFQSYNNGQVVVPANGTTVNRDPKVFWHAPTNRWVMVIWSDNDGNGVEGNRQAGNGIDIYTSSDLLKWDFRDRFPASWLYECPDLYPLAVDGDPANTKWVLNDAEGEYVVGEFNGTTFSTNWAAQERMDKGRTTFDNGTFYAGLTFNHLPDGRVVQMAWMPANRGSSWSGSATVPAELRLKTFPEGVRITRNPVTELSGLRTGTTSWTDRTITSDPSTDPLTGVFADTYEIEAEFDLAGATASRFGFALHARSDGTSDRTVLYDRTDQTLYGAPLAPVANRVTMRLLVDRGHLEIFGNGGKLSYSDNVNFDSSQGSQGVRLFTESGSVRLVSLKLHRMGSGWGTGQSTLESNLTGPWQAVNGTWTDTAAGKRGVHSGDAFYLSQSSAADFTYQGDLKVVNGTAAALTFRANADATQHYSANIDTNGLLKLWRPGRVIATYPTTITLGRTYHLKVVAAGSNIKVYLNNSATPVIDATDTAYASGRLGINSFNSTSEFQNVYLDTGGFRTNIPTGWQAVNGTWTDPAGGKRGVHSGDAFYLSGTTAADFTYEGDLRVLNGTAAALTFRANADATQHYSANIDTNGLLKLWRPGHVIATYPTAITLGRTYHLKVVAAGSNIKVYLNNSATPVIDATDTAYASGRLGINTFNGTSEFQDVNVFIG
ncbi:glycoside hydrolase family 32 protein [Streptomyces sp. NPDC049597]|uniref:glycoside hydrolase family 32 protein n=1 Tax=Streptomyces sp. NPDC049597 TaxID=3155276 RepID=UPI0034465A81